MSARIVIRVDNNVIPLDATFNADAAQFIYFDFPMAINRIISNEWFCFHNMPTLS